jgi:ABC-type lipoprotein export system ATPase subunit
VVSTSAASAPRILPAPCFAIEATGVNHAYEGQDGWVRALEGFEIAIPRNEFLCLLGPSGCGKSSFLRIVVGLMKPLEGIVQLDGKRIEGPGLDRGIVFQEPALFPWLTALCNVAFGLEMSGLKKDAVNARAVHVLRVVGLERAVNLYPYQLSGGVRHRVAVARAWALPDASVLLMEAVFGDRCCQPNGASEIPRRGLARRAAHGYLRHPRHRRSNLPRGPHRNHDAVARPNRAIRPCRLGASPRSQLRRSQPPSRRDH